MRSSRIVLPLLITAVVVLIGLLGGAQSARADTTQYYQIDSQSTATEGHPAHAVFCWGYDPEGVDISLSYEDGYTGLFQASSEGYTLGTGGCLMYPLERQHGEVIGATVNGFDCAFNTEGCYGPNSGQTPIWTPSSSDSITLVDTALPEREQLAETGFDPKSPMGGAVAIGGIGIILLMLMGLKHKRVPERMEDE